jgi:hypothetical protein
MNWMSARIEWIMFIAGVLTCTMVYAVIAPELALRSMFGTTLEGPLTEIIARNWGALIVLVGALLIYGAFRPAHRAVILVTAIVSKTIFIGLVLTFGTSLLHHQVGVSVVIDSVMVVLFTGYLLVSRHDSPIA